MASSSGFNSGFQIADPFSRAGQQSELLAGIYRDVEQFEGEIDAFFQEPSSVSSSSTAAPDINTRLDELIEAVKQLGARALSELKFVPEKVRVLEGRLSVVQSEWDLVGRDNQFQDGFHRFYSMVQRLSEKRVLTDGERALLQNSFLALPAREQQDLAPILGVSSSGVSSSSTSIGEWDRVTPATLLTIKGRLDRSYLPQKVDALSPERGALLNKHLAKFDPADEMRYVKAFSQLSLSDRNTVMVQLWKELAPVCPKPILIRLLSHSPLLENVRNATQLHVLPEVVDQLKNHAALMVQFSTMQANLELRYPFLKPIFENSSHPITKGMNEKRMQVIMARDISRLESYFNILRDLCEQPLPSADVLYLLEVIHNQFTQAPAQSVLGKECALNQLKKIASRAIRERTFADGYGLAYKTIFLVGSKENPYVGSKKNPLGKYKPLERGLAFREKLGEAYNALLGTDFAPPADGVELSIKKELQMIQAYLRSSREQEALERFAQLPKRVKDSIFHKLNKLKNLAEGNYPDTWMSSTCATEDRLEAIRIYLEEGAYDRFKKDSPKERQFPYGTLQCWVDNCSDGRKVLREDPLGGEKLSRIPVTVVQFYTLLGIIKGCRDGHEANTLFRYLDNGEIAQIIDCDDEHIMPRENTYQQVRMWTLGFPQAAQPLSRPLMRMLAAPDFAQHFRRYNPISKAVDPVIYQRQDERLLHMRTLCEAALNDPSKPLTVQDLYFNLFGGREKYAELLTGGELYKQMLKDAGMAVPNDPNPPSPAIIFDHFMIDRIRGDYAVVRKETVDFPMFQQNLRALGSGASSSSSSST